ncbi:MAG: hypothetical protein ABEJ78_08830, partial [Haloferacaceae archaeon]
MRQYASVLAVVALLAAAIAGPAAAVVAPADAPTQVATTGAPDNASDVKPGHRFAGVVGVQQAEIEGEMEERTFGVRVTNATNETKADVVAAEVNQLRERLRELRAQREQLREARANGTISEGTYRSRMAIVLAKTRTTTRMLSASEAVSRTLPAAALEAHGVSTDEIQRLRRDADEMSGPEVAALARSVVGEVVGRDHEDDDQRGPDDLPTQARGGPDGERGPDGSPDGANGRGNETAENGAGNGANSAGGPPDEAQRGESNRSDRSNGDSGEGNENGRSNENG